jgi:undecaprenyl-diphosphatase
MLSYIQAIILGAIQGVTELFPISSLGHSVILPKLLGWSVDQHDNLFLIFLVATHLATALVLLGFFFKDWVLIVKGIVRSLKIRRIDTTDTYARLGWLIIVASIPAGILGLLFEDSLKNLFAIPQYAAFFLLLNGFLLYGAEMLKKNRAKNKILSQHGTVSNISMTANLDSSPPNDSHPNNHDDSHIAQMSWSDTIKIGAAQCLALIPGFSRTGSTIAGGLLIGLDHENAARFSFLLATPIILAASVLKLPELATAPGVSGADIGTIVVGALAAAVTAFLSIKFLTKYFETKKLTPFATYCVAAGAVASLIFLIRP